MLRTLLLSFTLIALTASVSGLSDVVTRKKTQDSFIIQGLNTGSNIGWLGGLHKSRYFGNSNLYWGAGGYYGTSSGTNLSQDKLWKVGALLGLDTHLNAGPVFDLNVLVGYANGQLSGSSHDGIFIEPSVGLGFLIGNGWRLKLAFGYQHFTDTPDITGTTFSIRLERKTRNVVRPVNEDEDKRWKTSF